MSNKALYNIDPDKALEAIVWLASTKPGIDVYHIAKVLFYADKSHLNKHGRPVLGDNYYKMPYGPAPSTVLNIINLNSYNLSSEFLDKVEQSIQVRNRNKNTNALREPDLSYFSKSDLDCLKVSLTENGDKSFDELFTKTHDERCYLETDDSDIIDYQLMVDDTNQHAEEIKASVFEQSRYVHC